MKVKINRVELLEVLEKLKPLVGRAGNFENSFYFYNNNIFTYNEEACIFYPFVFLDSEKKFPNCFLPANKLIDVLSIINDTVDIKEENIIFKSKGALGKLKILSIPDEIISIIESFNFEKLIKNKWLKLPKEFIDGISLCLFSVIKNDIISCLDCINVNNDEIISSDNSRVSRFKISSKIKDSFLIPYNSAKEIIKYSIIEYQADDTWIYFKTKENIIFCLRRITEKYPEVDTFFNNFKGKNIILPEGLKESINTASILAEGDFSLDKEIDIIIEDGKIKCIGENNVGLIEAVLSIESKVKISFTINPSFFSSILDLSNYMVIGKESVLFKSKNFEHLIALINN